MIKQARKNIYAFLCTIFTYRLLFKVFGENRWNRVAKKKQKNNKNKNKNEMKE